MPGEFRQSDDRQRVLDATDIVQLVGDHVKLHAKGREFVGLCPFHDDHKPSMYVVPAKQIYHCFSCGAGGNALDFAINYHKMEFLDALRFLAERGNVELTPRGERQSNTTDGDTSSRAELLTANAFALDFFRLVLRHPERGADARRMIASREFTDEIVEQFQIGAAPDGWDGLITTAHKKGVSVRSLMQAGLAKPPRDGRSDGYDTFRHRLIFPICDQIGRPIAFGGRKLRDEDEPKYLNSPESIVFDKSSTLYALHLASRAIQKDGRAIVTEGYTDVIACHQAGFENVVATLGTALTPRHARALQRLCNTIVLLFDGDAAGAKAADRAIEVFFSQPVDVKIAVMPGGLDPADLLAEPNGADRFRDLIGNAVDALDHRLLRLRERLAGAGLSERAQVIDEEIGRLVELGLDRQPIVRRQMIIRRIASLAGVDETSIIGAIKAAAQRASLRGQAVEAEEGVEEEVSPADLRKPEAHAIGCLLCDPSLRATLMEDDRDILESGAYPPGPLRRIVETMEAAAAGESQASTTASVIDGIKDDSARRLAARLVRTVTSETGGETARLAAHFHECVRRSLLIMQKRNTRPVSPSNDDGAAESVLARIQARQAAIAKFGQDPLAHAKSSEPTPTGAG